MKTLVALIWLFGSALAAHATQATITAYHIGDISLEAMRKITVEECQARYSPLWTLTCDLPLKQEVKTSQTTDEHSATVQLFAEPDAQEPAKTSVKCQVDDEIKRTVPANSILRLQTRISLPSGKPMIVFGALSSSGKVGETKSEALLYVMQLDEKKR